MTRSRTWWLVGAGVLGAVLAASVTLGVLLLVPGLGPAAEPTQPPSTTPTLAPSPTPTQPPDQPPQIQEITLDPTALRFLGGQVRVRAQVEDDQGVQEIRGVVLLGDRQVGQLDFPQPRAQPQQFASEASFSVGPNTRSDGVAETYTFEVTVVDTAGQEVIRVSTVEVPAPSAPPAPPQL